MRHFPNRDRLSVLTAIIVLAYALSRFLDLPAQTVNTTLFGTELGVELGWRLVIQVLIAALISTGADALIRSHPRFAAQTTLIHWIVPGAAALVLGAGLERLPTEPAWWAGMAASALALLAVLTAEYIVVDGEDRFHDAASLGLSVLAYGLAFVLFAVLHNTGARAAIAVTLGGGVAAALAGRLIALSVRPVRRVLIPALVVGLMCAETVWAVSYWRVNSVGGALLVMLPFYIGVGLARQHLTGQLSRRSWVEFAVVGAVALAVTLSYVIQSP
jgi:hypothetical protein